jgi:hypothetical protein
MLFSIYFIGSLYKKANSAFFVYLQVSIVEIFLLIYSVIFFCQERFFIV